MGAQVAANHRPSNQCAHPARPIPQRSRSATVEKAIGKKGREELRELDRAFFSWEKFAWRDAPRELMCEVDPIDWTVFPGFSGEN
jgi:hypothetical protein